MRIENQHPGEGRGADVSERLIGSRPEVYACSGPLYRVSPGTGWADPQFFGRLLKRVRWPAWIDVPAIPVYHKALMEEHLRIKVAPSILSADFARLADAVAEAEAAGADYIHVDVMDGQFVPNLTVGPPVVAAIRRVTRLPLDVHLMMVGPERHLRAFADAGADILTVQVEACTHLHRVLQTIHALGMRAGVALNPATPPVMISQVLTDIDLVLVMTVNPGFGGQVFIPTMVPKIAEVRRMLDQAGSAAELEVDGGINPETAPLAVRAGARVLVAGKAIYGADVGVAAAIRALRESVSFLTAEHAESAEKK